MLTLIFFKVIYWQHSLGIPKKNKPYTFQHTKLVLSFWRQRISMQPLFCCTHCLTQVISVVINLQIKSFRFFWKQPEYIWEACICMRFWSIVNKHGTHLAGSFSYLIFQLERDIPFHLQWPQSAISETFKWWSSKTMSWISLFTQLFLSNNYTEKVVCGMNMPPQYSENRNATHTFIWKITYFSNCPHIIYVYMYVCLKLLQ